MNLTRHVFLMVLAGMVASVFLISGGGASAGIGGSAPTPGCGQAAAGGKVSMSTRDGAGHVRTYWVEAPANYDPNKAHALVFVFHGAGGNGNTAASWGLQKTPGAADAIFVFPNGIAYQHFGVGWDDTSRGYDLPFFDHMLAETGAHYCVDSRQVFAAGFSWGGDFAMALACNRGDELAAIAANSTNDEFKDTSKYMTYQNLPCSTRVHPRIRFEHAVDGDEAYPPPDFATTSELFRYLNSCGRSSTPVATTRSESCVAYAGCSSAYLECAFDHALGHTLPPNWAADTWAFFMAPQGR